MPDYHAAMIAMSAYSICLGVLSVLCVLLMIAVTNLRKRHEKLRADSVRMFAIQQNILADMATKMRAFGMTNVQPIPDMAEWMAALKRTENG